MSENDDPTAETDESINDRFDLEAVEELLANSHLTDSPLDMENDLHYLLGLIGDVMENDEDFENDTQRAEWAVARWCQELLYAPDLREYGTGQNFPMSEIPDNCSEAFHYRADADD